MTLLRIRIDNNNLTNKDIAEWFSLWCSELVIVHHQLPHGNPHYHLYANCDLAEHTSTQAMRMRIKRKFDITKSSDYSVKQCDGNRVDEYISYMFNTKHGNVATLIFSNIDSNRLDKCILLAKQVSDNFDLSKRSRKPTTITQYDMSDEVYKLVLDKYKIHTPLGLDIIELQKRDIEIYEDCVKAAIDVCHKHRKGFDFFSINKIIIPAYTRFSNCRISFVDKIVSKFFL